MPRLNCHFKERKPEETVSIIREILLDLEIETEEHWLQKSELDTFSLRITIKGTNIGTNGKGLNRAYARASAYGEFMERLENIHMASLIGSDIGKEQYYLAPDEVVFTVDELLNQNNAFLSRFFKDQNAFSKQQKRDILSKLSEIDQIKHGLDQSFVCLPFYDALSSNTVYMPYSIYRPYFGSNGMCAGNTDCEALVQGFSEIIERLVQRKTCLDFLSFPDIPDSFLKGNEALYNRIQKIASDNRFNVKLKDCSMNGLYPVVALIVLRKDNGRYGVKFGAHPNIWIAIERTLTEATQGPAIDEFANFSYIDYSNENVSDRSNICNGMMDGIAQYPYQLILNESPYRFCDWSVKDTESNHKMLQRMVHFFMEQGISVFIRNTSFLGFPAFHIIIPTLSEMEPVSMEDYQIIMELPIANKLIRDPSQISDDNIDLLIRVIQHFSYKKELRFFYNSSEKFEIPYEQYGCDLEYFLALLHYYKDDYQKALDYVITAMEVFSIYGSKESDDGIHLLAFAYYLNGLLELKSFETSKLYIQTLFHEKQFKIIEKMIISKETLFFRYPTVSQNSFDEKIRQKTYSVRSRGHFTFTQNSIKDII